MSIIFNLHQKAKNIYSSDTLSPEEKYDLIFSASLSRKVFDFFHNLGLPLNYYDPDTSYEEDVDAFMSAFNEQMNKLEQNSFLLEE